MAEQKVQEDLAANSKGVNSSTPSVAQTTKSEELTKHLEDVVQKALAAVKESQDEQNSKIDTMMEK